MRRSRASTLSLGALAIFLGSARGQDAVFDGQLQRPKNGVFHEKLLLDRSFEYRDDSFLSALSYRPRYPLRVLSRLASTGYSLAVGSVSTSDFLLDQEARLRLPLSNAFIFEFDFLQAEDYDERYVRATGEVAFMIPGTGRSVPTALTLLGNTPPAWGLFVGGSAELNAFKEFDDAGAFLGYRNSVFGTRIDLVFPAAFYNSKNRSGGEIDGLPVSVLAQVEAALSDEGPYLSAWLTEQPRVQGTFPDEKLAFGSIETTRGGFELVLPFDRTVVFDLDLSGELTRKRRRFTDPATADAFRRRAGTVFLEANIFMGGRTPRPGISADDENPSWFERPYDRRGVGPELSSRDVVVPRDVLARSTPADWAATDVLELGAFAQYLDESAVPRGVVGRTARVRRRELYAYAGYVLTLPSVLEGLALHPAFYAGYVFSLEIGQGSTLPSQKDEGLLAKVNGAVEYRFRDNAVLVGNMSFRLDAPQFGGGNVQLVVRY